MSAQTRTASLQKVALQLDARPDPPIDRPGALVPFFERLYALSNGESPTAPRSYPALRRFPHGLRRLDRRAARSFQNRFGNGGAGFSLAGIPFQGYRRFDVRRRRKPSLGSAGGRTGEGDGFFGLGGYSISTERAGQYIYLDADCASVEVDYLQQPDGGRVELTETAKP